MGDIINWMGGWPKEGLLSEAEWEERRTVQSERSEPSAREQGEGGESELEAMLRSGQLWEGASAGMLDSKQVYAVQGADAALQMAVKALLRPGDTVLTERPTSRLALQAFRRAGAGTMAVSGDAEGMDPDALKLALAAVRPRLVYVSLTSTDPEGRSWSAERSRALFEHCAAAGVLIVLDERQALLRDPDSYTCIRGAASAYQAAERGGGVLAIGELPPGLIGGLRLGWISLSPGLPEEDRERLKQQLNSSAVHSPGTALRSTELDQLTLLAYWQEQPPAQALETLRFICQSRHALLVERLQQAGAGIGLACKVPASGIHTWITLPEGLDADALLRASWLKGVLFQPGAGFYTSEPDPFKLRITAVHSDDKEIREGIRRIGEAIGEFMGRSV